MSDRGWGKPNFLVNSQDFYKAVDKLEGRTQIKHLRGVLRNTSRSIYIPALKSRAKMFYKTGRLYRSMGNVTGKSRYSATMFVGPRVPRGYRDADTKAREAYTFHGGVANILEYWKDPKKRKTRFRLVMRTKAKAVQSAIARGVKELIFR